MRTPIVDFLKEYSTRGATRMHMPGHKGSLSSHDITELDGADVLYSPSGIIRESEENAALLFGTARTVYSAEGSSLSIKAMLALTVMLAKERGEKPLILAGRNAHKTFINAAALLDFDIEWIYGDGLMECKLTAEKLISALSGTERTPTALYITSPDYLGNICDIRALSDICRSRGMLLLVDNAHGAYLRFLEDDIHPISLGAHMCCDSAHKTLPALTGAGYLHISKDAPPQLCERADEAMAIFASTSPSYLILESLDSLNAYIESSYREKLKIFAEISNSAKRRLSNSGFSLIGDEILKITLKTKEYGYTGRDIERFLYRSDIVCEFADEDFLVLMLSPEFSQAQMERLISELLRIPRKEAITSCAKKAPMLERKLSPRDAMLSASELVITDISVGRILASATVSCPPAVPIAMSGELITKEAAELFKYYGTEKIRVIK